MRFFSLKKKKYATLTVKNSKKIDEKEQQVSKEVKISGIWEKCPKCNEIIYKKDIENNLKRCPYCDYYFSMKAYERINLLIDKDTFQEMDKNLVSENPLDFPEYKDKYTNAVK